MAGRLERSGGPIGMKPIVSASVQTAPQFYDLDPLGIVWHGHYPRFLELARASLMDKIGYGYEAMKLSGFAWPIIDMHLRYARPMRLGQPVEIDAGIIEWENRLKIVYSIRDLETKARVMRAASVQVAVCAADGQMQWQSPPVLRACLEPYRS
jgi:acyl-CoA thioester hydrolase